MRSRSFTSTMSLGLLLLAACDAGDADDNITSSQPQPTLDAELRESLEQWGVIPIGSMATQPPAQVELGRALFFDRILSGNRDVACATCHHPTTSLSDGRSLPIGTGGVGLGPKRTRGAGRDFVPRSAPSLLNAGVGLTYLLWDGRLSGTRADNIVTEGFNVPSGLPNTLVAQAFLPVLDRREMRGNAGDTDVLGHPNELAEFANGQRAEIWDAVMRRVLGIPEYVDLFNAAFPDTPTSQLRFEHAARALAAFQREAFTKTRSPFDRYLDRDNAALTRQEKQGALLFFEEAQCGTCHNGPFLGGRGFANVGVPQIGPGTGKAAPLDIGRGGLPDNAFYRFAFRVAPLRNVELTAPYMHTGAYATLEAVVTHYNDVPAALRGYDVSQLDPALREMYHGDEATISAVLQTLDGQLQVPLDLSDEEKGDLVAFLKSLTDPAARDLSHLVPATVPSGLPVPR